nr:conjugal transfer protein TraR [Saccharospirillaceae bacterium]
MSDAIDQANEIAQRALDANIERARKVAPSGGSPWCEECGDEIPAARRDKLPWVTTCVECQAWLERQSAMRR